ncbi:MAG: ferredoxin reductase [Saccharospirillaceae bacterium]|nr:ferredoxin reductase [Saccharospirillaceae bacterium]MCD8531978.1 ferredoxin reductase [Saccharospirillaceae bacterium]
MTTMTDPALSPRSSGPASLAATTAVRLRRWLASSLTQHDHFTAYFEPLVQLFLPGWTTSGWRARVLEVRTELEDVYSLVLRPVKGWAGFQAGQYVEISVEQDGRRVSRIFSISSSPAYFAQTGLIELTIRVQDKGRITPWLRQHLAAGGLVNLSAAQGDFVLTHDTQPLLFIAGGSGITPFRSMLQNLLSGESERPVHLLYYARHAQHFLFREEFDRLQLAMPYFSLTLLNNEEHGFIRAEHIRQYCSDYALRETMICGPTPMIQAARTALSELNVDPAQIRFEYFGAAPIDRPRADATDTLVAFRRSAITADVAAQPAQTLLEVAEQAGLRPVSGCRIGVCHQCICKKESGVVFNTKTGAYSDTGSEEIQLCISVAASDLILDL